MSHKVADSLRLNRLYNNIDGNTSFWYVDRRARIIEFRVALTDKKSSIFFRKRNVMVSAYDVLKEKFVFEETQYLLGDFFDKFVKYGHFFLHKNNAVKYMNERVKTKREDIVKKAYNYIENNPQYLI